MVVRRSFDRATRRSWAGGIRADCRRPGGDGGAGVVHDVRERAGAPAGAVARRDAACTRSTRRTTSSEIFAVGAGRTGAPRACPVGLEPVAVAARGNSEVWVVNHLSDSISIVDVASVAAARHADAAGRRRAARHRLRAARRQSRLHHHRRTAARTARAIRSSPPPASAAPTSGCSTRPTSAPRSAARRSPSSTLFTDTPRARRDAPTAAPCSPRASITGNRTTALNEGLVCNGGAGAAPCTSAGVGDAGRTAGAEHATSTGMPRPEVGLIVKFRQRARLARPARAELEQRQSRFALPDSDVFAINALATPAGRDRQRRVGVGTILFNMAINPVIAAGLRDQLPTRRTTCASKGPGVLARLDACAATCTRRASRCSSPGGVVQPPL